MNREMTDILACPIDKAYPLELFEAEGEGDEISEGALFCAKCSRFYPIMEGIPIMLPDELRDRDREVEFLTKFKGVLPEKIALKANPWHL